MDDNKAIKVLAAYLYNNNDPLPSKSDMEKAIEKL